MPGGPRCPVCDEPVEHCRCVISLWTRKPIDGDPKPTSERSPMQCMHRGWVIDVRKRTLTCQECGADVDPFTALNRVAMEWDRVSAARAEHKRLHEHMARLRAEEKRVKARTRNAERKEADAAVAAERERIARQQEQLAKWADEIADRADSIRRATASKRCYRRIRR